MRHVQSWVAAVIDIAPAHAPAARRTRCASGTHADPAGQSPGRRVRFACGSAAPPSANSRVARPDSAKGVGNLDSPLVTPFADPERATPGEPPAPPPRSVVAEQRLQSAEPAPQTTMVQTETEKVFAPEPRPPWNRQRVRTEKAAVKVKAEKGSEKGSGTFSAAEKVPDPFSAVERRVGEVVGSRKHKVATSPPHHLTTPLPLWLHPLIWSNRLFDGCAAWLARRAVG